MKTLALSLFALALSAPAFGAQVNAARYNEQKQSIDVDLSYGGGCEEHVFKLEINACLESYPVRCDAVVKDVTPRPDMCEAFIHKTVSFKLADHGLLDSYYDGASIQIRGAGGDRGALVLLPRK